MKAKGICLAVLGCLAMAALAGAAWAAEAKPGPVNLPAQKEFRVERGVSPQARACLECHRTETPGLFADWAMSRHASSNITCLDCHQAQESDQDVSQVHFKQYERSDNKWGVAQYRAVVAAVVTPKDCSRCHPDEAKQYNRSKHANTLEIIWKIDPWLNFGLNDTTERVTGCLHCHGTVLEVKDGKLTPDTWPNVGVGRINLDGSKGSCSSCHTRHAFKVSEARKPEACGQCHLGPDHPQIEIYTESKHGAIYHAEGTKWKWDSAPGTWTAGVDFRAPTCAACHMSGGGEVTTSHDVTLRLAWEIQAPLTVRPNEFKPFPADTNPEVERKRMKAICLQCHEDLWVNSHFNQFDAAVANYNDVYYKPALARLNEMYEKKLMDPKGFFKQPLWTEFYELWHHEGRRARMGAAMMAPDYAWWHGFYECKKRFVNFFEATGQLIQENKKAYMTDNYPGTGGSTEKPPQIFAPAKK
ncbi:MAG: hydroxylamine oxidoreductase [Deltaproteobacteria bacterium]|nr:hydroxylamine oxidoreductase [Deltaproteobacteria bacterium]